MTSQEPIKRGRGRPRKNPIEEQYYDDRPARNVSHHPQDDDIPSKRELQAHLKSQGKTLPRAPSVTRMHKEAAQRKVQKTERLKQARNGVQGGLGPQTFYPARDGVNYSLQNPLDRAMSVSDIQSIIVTASQNNVACLKWRDIEVTFLPSTVGKKAEEGVSPRQDGKILGEVDLGKVTQQGRIVETPEERELREEARRAQLMTDDPLAYENEMIDATLNPRVMDEAENSRRTEQDIQ